MIRMVVLSIFWLMSPRCLMVELAVLITHNIIIHWSQTWGLENLPQK